MNVIFSITVMAVFLALPNISAAADFRYLCAANPSVSCGPLNATTSRSIATNIAQDSGAVVNDSIVIYTSNWNGSHYVEKWREFSVVNAPVINGSDLYDWGAQIDVTDYAPPAPGIASLDGPGLPQDWIFGYVGVGVVWYRN